MNRRRIIILTLLMALLLIQVIPANAHSPSITTLTYDFAEQELHVIVSHSVTDTTSHRIAQVIVEKNSVVIITRNYAVQNSTSAFEAYYDVSAVHGAVFRVTAVCSISGQDIGQVIVEDPASITDTTTPPNGGTWMDMTLIIAGTVVVIGVIAVVFVFIRRR